MLSNVVVLDLLYNWFVKEGLMFGLIDVADVVLVFLVEMVFLVDVKSWVIFFVVMRVEWVTKVVEFIAVRIKLLGFILSDVDV